MAITKQYLKSKPECKLTFSIPAEQAEKVQLSGEFNDWNSTELKKFKNGNFKTQVNVPVDKEYQFKYIVDGEWMNDAEADGYKWNEFAGSDNSVVKV